MNDIVLQQPGLIAIAVAVVFVGRLIAGQIRQSLEPLQCCLKHGIKNTHRLQENECDEKEQVERKVADNAFKGGVREVA